MIIFNIKYKKTNVNEITRELGITRTAFYYYFNDKKDFYDYLLYEKREEFMQTYVYNQQNKIDFFDLLLKLFDYLSNYKGMPQEGFFKDLFINIDYVEQNNLLEQIVSKDKSTK